jgi:vitamin B12 transporter
MPSQFRTGVTATSVAVCLASSMCPAITSAQSLGEVVVTATRTERDASTTLADVTVVDRPAIERAGASTVTELLQSTGALEISQNGGAGAVSGLFVRGTRTSQTLVLVDGVRLENPTSGTGNLEFLPLSSVDRIEIVRGPMSSLYGSAAMGGVVQIFTRRATDAPGATVSVGAGSRGSLQGQASLAGGSGATRFALSAFGDRSDGYDATLPGSPSYQPDPDGNSRAGGSASLQHRLGGGWQLGASLLGVSGRARYDDAWTSPEDARLSYRTTALTGWLRGSFSQGWDTELRLGDSRIDYTYQAFSFAPRTTSRSLIWQNTVRLPVGQLLFGLEQLRQEIEGEGVTTGPTPYLRDSRRTDSLFAGYEAIVGRHLWRAQLRYDRIETVGSEPTGTLAWGYRLTDRWLARASVASAFRAPTFDDLYNPFGSNPYLVPETSLGGEAALEYRAGQTLLKSTLFASRIRDAIELDASYVPQNLDSARVQGLTVEARHRTGPWSMRGSVTWQHTEGERFDPASGEVVTGPLARRARQYAAFGVDRVEGPWRVGAEWVLQGPRVDANGRPMAGYGVLSLSASWALQRGRDLFVRLGNVGDKVYETAWGYRMPPRSVFVGLRWQAG